MNMKFVFVFVYLDLEFNFRYFIITSYDSIGLKRLSARPKHPFTSGFTPLYQWDLKSNQIVHPVELKTRGIKQRSNKQPSKQNIFKLNSRSIDGMYPNIVASTQFSIMK